MGKVNVLTVDVSLLSQQLRAVMRAVDRRRLSRHDRNVLGGLEHLLSDMSSILAEGSSAVVCERVSIRKTPRTRRP
jgi:hypothetical protein